VAIAADGTRLASGNTDGKSSGFFLFARFFCVFAGSYADMAKNGMEMA
jgi:hypothetical protein